MKKSILVATMILMLGVACKDKEKAAPPVVDKQETEQPKPSVPDTTKNEEEKVSEPEPKPEPQKPNKYFLIAGSFAKPDNAESFKEELKEQGFESEVITRNWGKNSEFYKVSYMGFRDRAKAISTMKQERQKQNRDSVWVLVKR